MTTPAYQPRPRFLYHWTEALHAESILELGLQTSCGGFCGEHEDDPGVNLTSSGADPNVSWNENIFHLARPVRITIDTHTLVQHDDAWGPDMNSLMEDGVYGDMLQAGVDPDEPAMQTLEASLHFSGNCRYRGEIPAAAIVEVIGFHAPRHWKADPFDYGYEHEYDEQGRMVASADWHVTRQWELPAGAKPPVLPNTTSPAQAGGLRTLPESSPGFFRN